MTLVANQVLAPCLGSGFFDCPQRILSIDVPRDEIWCISLPRRRKNGHVMGYVRGPRPVSLNGVETAITQGLVRVAAFKAPGYWSMTDDDYVKEVMDDQEQDRRRSRLKKRDQLWAAIKPLVNKPETFAPWSCLTYAEIAHQATQHHVSVPTIYRAVHIYWAGGSAVNALMPYTHRCGAPGNQRAEYKCRAPKLGSTRVPYPLSVTDRERLAQGYMLITPERTARDAYLQTCAAFWSTTTVDPNGQLSPELFPPDERPTFRQFLYWGAKLTGKFAKAARLGLRHPKGPTHHGGSVQDLVAAVGQLAMFDSTSTDVYLTSIRSRLIKLPPMTRSLVMDVRSTAYVGLYCGWEHPSPRTGLRAIYGAATNKVDLCKRFGIEIGSDDWPGMVFRIYLADNGELKAESLTDAERQIGFSIEYARSYSGASKGIVEAQHHTDHKRLDHRIPGTTHGKRRERGMPHAVDDALWNYYEYMRELLLCILAYNQEEVPKLAPTEMLNAGIRPTRINIFKWLRDHGQRADISCDLDQLRALTLPEWDAIIQYNGIVVKTADGKRNVNEVRFFCPALRADPRFQQANRDRKIVKVKVRFEPENFSELWLPASRGLLRIPNVTSDAKAQREDTLADFEQRFEFDASHRKQSKAAREQADLETSLRHDAISVTAKRERQEEISKSGKKISKSAQRRELRQNAENEQRLIGRLEDGVEASAPTTTAVAPTPSAGDAAELAVAAFLARVGGSDEAN